MNKKVLSALLFGALFAGTGTFTSCIDTDEPAGIENLRDAKAQLIVAKVEVEKAEAARLMAVAEYEKAKAAHEQANATYRLAEAKYKEAEAAYKEAQTAQEQARFENEMAKAELDMEVAAKQHELTMLDFEKQLTELKRAHEITLKQIEIAKALGSESEKVTLAALEQEVKDLYVQLYGYNGLGGLTADIRTAEEKLYNATLNKEAGEGVYNWIPTLKMEVEKQKANVAAAEETVEKWANFLENDVETVDWRAEHQALLDSVEVLEKAITVKDVEISKALNSKEYLAARQKVYGIGNEKGTEQLLADAENDYNTYTVGGTLANGNQVEAIEVALTTISVPVSSVLVDEINDGIVAADQSVSLSKDKKGNDVITIQNTVGKDGKKVYNQPFYGVKLNADNGYVPAKALKEVEAWEKALAKTTISANSVEQKKRELAKYEKAEAKADSLYNEVALPIWKSALAVMDGGAATATIPAGETKKVTDAIAAYNTAVAAYTTAKTTAETTYNNIFNTDSVAKLTELYNNAYWTKFEPQAQADLKNHVYGGDASLAENAIKLAILEKEANDYEGKIAAVKALYVTKVKDNAATTNVNEATEAQKVVDKALADNEYNSKAAADKAQYDNATTWKAAAGAAGKAAVDKDLAKGDKSTIKAAQKAESDAKAKIAPAYDKMKAAYEDYNKLAKDYYAMVPHKDAKGLPASGTAVAEADVAKMVLLALSDKDDVKAAAWNNASVLAFGKEGMYVELTAADVKAGALYDWAKAQKNLADCQNEIAAADKLAEVVKALADAKTALKAETTANEAKFAELAAAVEAADKANEEAIAALEAIEVELVGDLQTEREKLHQTMWATRNVANRLMNAISQYIGNDGNWYDYSDVEDFEKFLEDQLQNAKDALIAAEHNLAKVEKNLKVAEEGKYDGVAQAQYELDVLNAELEKLLAELEEANARLETAIEIMIAE